MFADIYRALPCGLVFLTAFSTAYTLSHPETEHHRSVPLNRLRPISITNYEAAVGLQRRSSEDFSDLGLLAQSELIYGSPGDSGLLLANMTLYASDGLLMILMERFEGLTSSVDCKGDDGTMSLTFSSLNAFDYALQSWIYINDNDDGQFLLIANHEGCGPDDHRQPYLISGIIEDTATLTTYLKAKPVPWSDVAGTYDLDFGQAIYYQSPQSIKGRGFWGDIENVGKDVLDAATGNADLSKTVDFPLNIGQQGRRANIFTDDKGRLTLDCINCFLSGSFAVTGHISVDQFSLQDLTLKGSPQGLQAALQLEATITSSDELESLQYTKEIFSFPIPDVGIEIEGIFKLGATLSYDVGVNSSFSGSATIDFGLQAGIPDSAQITADIQNPDSSSATGWGGGSLTPLFDIKKESASVKLAAFSQPKLAFGIEIIEVGNIDVAITFKLPEVSVTLNAAYDEDGVCEAGSSKTGIKLDSEVDIEVDLEIDAELGEDEDTAKPSWSQTLYAYAIPLGSMCFPLDIPGLNSSSSATTMVPSLPASILQSMVSTAGSFVSVSSSAVDGMVGVGGTSSGSTTSDGGSVSTGLSALGELTTVLGTHSGSRPLSPSAVVSYSGSAGADVLNPTTMTPSFASTISATVAVASRNTKTEIVHSHASSIPLTSSDTFTFPGDDRFANINANPMTASSSRTSLRSSSSVPVTLGDGDDIKAAVIHPKIPATTMPKNSSIPPNSNAKPASDPLPKTNPTVEKNIEDLPPKPKVTPPPEAAKKPVPVVPATTSKLINAVTSTTLATGGGGCRMARRFGKRMLIC